jgi:hypothetical protein
MVEDSVAFFPMVIMLTSAEREAALKAERNVLDMKWELEEAESGLQAVKKALNFDLDLTESYEPSP